MGFETRNRKGNDEGVSSNDIGMKVEIIEEGILEEACEASNEKEVISELENIIMEGDIILNVHADADNEEAPEPEFQIQQKPGVGEYCAQHEELFHYDDEKLVKPGDTFASHKDFIQYISTYAKRWCFYYKCTESYHVDTENETYIYNCVYLKNKDYKRKSFKKRYNSKTDCPCKIKLKRSPNEGLTVVYVCNHHDHKLSEEDFNKLVNTRKLPPYIKEVIMDLLSLEVEIAKIKKFVEVETGIKMSRAFFYDIERKMKIYNEERNISEKRLKELSDKIAVIDDMYSCDEEADNTDDNLTQAAKKRVRTNKVDKLKKRKKLGSVASIGDNETTQSISGLKFDLTNESNDDSSWVNDQCVPGTKNRNSTITWDISSIQNNDESQLTADDDTQDYTDNGETTYTNEEYETTEYTEGETTETNNANSEGQNNQFQYQTVVLQDEFGNVINCDSNEQIVIIQQDENGVAQADGETIGYFDGEKIIYMDEANMGNVRTTNEANETTDQNDDSAPNDVAVQTNTQKPGHSYVPVFDVYMKDGNVTGFIVNDKVAKQGGIEKGVQTPEDTPQNESRVRNVSEALPEETLDIPATHGSQEIVSGDTYTKHEYIHRYNIDHYMTKPNFPKYIETLAKKTRNDALHMLTKVYNEKAMFKMTTTQRGKEGNTKIWYLTDVRRKGQYKMSDEEKRKRDKIGQYLTDIVILKETVKGLKKENGELNTRNKYLEEVALRLANMRNN